MSVLPNNEPERLKALQNYNILDSLPEEEFNRITQLAAIICDTPIALISLVDKDRQWFKASVGLDVKETHRQISFCQYTILDVNLFQVENAMEDERFKDNPLVTGNPNIRFYAGYPLQDPNGFNLGTLCVINQEPQKLTPQQEKALQLLAQDVVANMVNRKNNVEREQLAKLFELSLNLMCIATTEGTFVEINQTWEDVLGYVTEDLKGTSFLDLIHPDDIQATLGKMGELSEQNNVINFINRYRAKDGTYKLIEWQASPLGNIIYAVARDVTEIEQNKKELQKTNSVLKEAEKITKMGSWELDLATNITYWTDEVYAIHEVEKDFDHNKVNGIEFYHPDYRQVITDAITKSIVEQVPFDEECKFITAKGNEKWVRSTGHPIVENGKVVKLYGAFIDITGEKIKKELLLKDKNRLNAIIEGTNVGTWEWDVQTGETVFNQKWAEIIGYSLEEISPVSIDTWMKFAHPDDLPESERLLNAHFEGKLDYYNFESRMKHKNGHWVWVLDRGKVVSWTEEGKPLMMYGTHQDVSQAKLLELELKQKNDNLIASEEEIKSNLEEQVTLRESLLKSNNLLSEKQVQINSILSNLDDYIYSAPLRSSLVGELLITTSLCFNAYPNKVSKFLNSIPLGACSL